MYANIVFLIVYTFSIISGVIMIASWSALSNLHMAISVWVFIASITSTTAYKLKFEKMKLLWFSILKNEHT